MHETFAAASPGASLVRLHTPRSLARMSAGRSGERARLEKKVESAPTSPLPAPAVRLELDGAPPPTEGSRRRIRADPHRARPRDRGGPRALPGDPDGAGEARRLRPARRDPRRGRDPHPAAGRRGPPAAGDHRPRLRGVRRSSTTCAASARSRPTSAARCHGRLVPPTGKALGRRRPGRGRGAEGPGKPPVEKADQTRASRTTRTVRLPCTRRAPARSVRSAARALRDPGRDRPRRNGRDLQGAASSTSTASSR